MTFLALLTATHSAREIQRGDEVAWYADGDTSVRSEFNPSTAYAFGTAPCFDARVLWFHCVIRVGKTSFCLLLSTSPEDTGRLAAAFLPFACLQIECSDQPQRQGESMISLLSMSCRVQWRA